MRGQGSRCQEACPLSPWGRIGADPQREGWGSARRLSFPEACKFQVNLFRPVEKDDAMRLERKWGVAYHYKLRNVTSLECSSHSQKYGSVEKEVGDSVLPWLSTD